MYYPAVDSGYYVLLRPLASGQHTIHFSGGTTFFNSSLDVTYHITAARVIAQKDGPPPGILPAPAMRKP